MNNLAKRILFDPMAGKVATLLGIELEEYLRLHHSEITPVKDTSGEIVKYFMVIRALNPVDILRKLKLNRFGMVYFSPDAFDPGESAQASN